jgi:hypothetical protein
MSLICLTYNLLRLIDARAKVGVDVDWVDDETLRMIDDIAAAKKGAHESAFEN